VLPARPRWRCESARASRRTWSPPGRKGLTFRRFVGRLGARLRVQWKTLNAADYGAPTHRRRLFLVARCDGLPIDWPEPTHGDPEGREGPLRRGLKPWRTAAECIDWSMPCPSIFDRKRPLAEATMRRIALGSSGTSSTTRGRSS
jgi:DNA (cytosine-5)-methyltransferase 1